MSIALSIIYIIVAGAVLVSMTTLLLRGEKQQSANKPFFLCQAMIMIWSISQVLVIAANNITQLFVAYIIGNLGICFIGTFWYQFAVMYTKGNLSLPRKMIPILISSVHLLFVVTNPLHHLYYIEFSDVSLTSELAYGNNVVHGPMFYSNVVVTYILLMIGAVLLFKDVQNDSSKSEDPAKARIMIVCSVLVPLVFNALYLVGIVKSSFDITPLGFAISAYLIMIATMKYQFMDPRKMLEITNEKLLLEQERNRIAQEVHDTAGHTLTMIQSYMKLADVSISKGENEMAATYVSDARKLTNQGIRELRESINQLRKEASYELVTQGVMQLANQLKEIPVEVTVQGEDGEQYSHLSKVIYDTVRESITNSMKYANASKIEVILKFKEKELELLICDNGDGCEEIVDNNGLTGIRNRIEQAGGTVRFMSGKGEGFLTKVRILL